MMRSGRDAIGRQPQPDGRGRHRRPAGAAADRPTEAGGRGRQRRTGRGVQGRRAPETAVRARRTQGRSHAPPIDPRIAARRAEVQAEAAEGTSRRRRRLALVTVVALVLAIAAAAALLSPLTSVQVIEVAGAQRTTAAEVRAASGLTARPPMIRVDEAQVRAAIAALPWVKEVVLDRQWPRTLVVTVVERSPAAVAPCQATGTSSCLIDATGRVLAPLSADPKGAAALPRLVGVPAAGPPGATVADAARGPLAVAVALPEALRPLVTGVRGEGSEVALDLQAPGRSETPPVIRLGGADRIPEKLTAAATVLARTSVNGVAVLDVRVPESPALTRVRR